MPAGFILFASIKGEDAYVEGCLGGAWVSLILILYLSSALTLQFTCVINPHAPSTTQSSTQAPSAHSSVGFKALHPLCLKEPWLNYSINGEEVYRNWDWC